MSVVFLAVSSDAAESLSPDDKKGAPYDFAQTHTLSLNEYMLSNCLAQVAEEFPLSRLSGPRVWYQNNLGFTERTFLPNCSYSSNRLFIYLLADSSRICDYETGHESPLREWVLSQADNSIDPVMMFRKSMQLNDGNIFDALLTIHQLLRNEARWWDEKSYRYNSSTEKERAFFNKLIDIRGDLVDRGGSNTGDHQGTWYRIWGMMLYRVAQAYRDDDENLGRDFCHGSTQNQIVQAGLDLKSFAIAILAEAVKPLIFFPENDGRRKAEYNQKAAYIGGALSLHISGIKGGEPTVPKKECESRAYLQRTFFD
jgi:hypothetical protein